MPNLTKLCPVLVPLLLLPPLGSNPQEAPSRALSRAITTSARLAGTSGSEVAALRVARELRAAGWEVELDRRVVLLSYPTAIRVAGHTIGKQAAYTLFERSESFDPNARPPGDVPKFNAWSGSGSVRAEVVDVGRGLRADYERLRASGVEIVGKIALASYGGAYRGVKAKLAEEAGCVGALLYSPMEEEGAGRGATWPNGPWKPGDAAQRGAISSLSICPGDPSTPGWPSAAPGVDVERLEGEALGARLPRILCTPLGVREAQHLRDAIARGETVSVEMELDVPRSYRPIVNVIGRLPGIDNEHWVIAGNHRDAWVRGAQDAGSGTVSLLRAAQRLGERSRAGERPASGILLGFWDAEEFGLIGSTEWVEANAEWLREAAVAYVNADAVVSGTNFNAGGTPGLEAVLEAALARIPAASGEGSLLDGWLGEKEERTLGLLGSGSDYTAFLHHLGIPALDISFGGNGGGQYHTRFDDFAMMDRFLDPEWKGHETAGALLAELLFELAARGHAAFDEARAARAMAQHAETAGEGFLGEARGERLAGAFIDLAEAIEATVTKGARPKVPRFLQALALPEGLAGRPWYRNPLWAPGIETGYAAESFPELRRVQADPNSLEIALDAMLASVEALRRAWLSPETGR